MAGSPGGIDTGVRAKVVVVPDTSKFVPSLEKYIKRVERSLRISIPTTVDPSGIDEKLAKVRQQQQRNPVTVPLQAQADEFTRQARAAAQKAARSVQADIPLTADGESLRRELARQVESLEKLTSLTVPLDLGMAAKFREDVLAQVAEVERLATSAARKSPIEVPVKAELAEFAKQVRSQAEKLERSVQLQIPATAKGERLRADLARSIAEVERLTEIEVPIGLKDAAHLRSQTLKAIAEVEAIARKASPKVKLDFDAKGSASRLGAVQKQIRTFIDSTSSGLQAAASSALSFVAGVTKSAGAVGALVAALGAGAAFAADLIVTIGPGLAATIPTLIAAGAAFGVIKLGSERLVKSLKPISKGFEDMKKSVGDALARGVLPLAEKFARETLPGIQAGLVKVAAPLNGVVRDLLSFGSSASGVKLINQLLAGAAAALKPLREAVTPFVTALAQIGVAAGPGLKLVTGYLADLATRFGNFINGAFKDGSLTTSITNAVTATGNLLGAMGRLGKAIFGTFADIGKGSTNGFTDTVNSIAGAVEKFNAAGGGQKIHDFVVEVFDYIKNIDWDKLKSQIQETIDKIKSAATAIDDAVAKVQGAINRVKSWVQSVRSAWNSIKTATSDTWNSVSSKVSGAASAVTRTVGSLRAKVTGAWASLKSATSQAWNSLSSSVTSAASRMTSSVKTKFSAVVTFVKSLPGKIVSALGNLGSLLLSAGHDLMAGLVAGIKREAGAVVGAVKGIAAGAVKALRSALKMHSPSRVMITLGRYVAQGFAIGILAEADKVKAAATSLTQKIQDAVSSYIKSKASIADKINADAIAVKKARIRYEEALKQHGKGAAAAVKQASLSLKSALNKLAKDQSAARTLDAASGNLGKLSKSKAALAAFVTFVQEHTKQLTILAKKRDQIADRLAAAKGKLEEAIKLRGDYAKSVADQARAFGSIIAQSVEGQALSASDVAAQLRAKLDALSAFRQNLQALKAQGLSDAALKQLVDAGVDAGSATAAALATGGQEAISQVNALTVAIGAQADALGTSASQQFYGAGVSAAQGLVDGLASQQAVIEAQMKRIADAMVKQIKKSLGIKSPSTVMAQNGRMISKGLAVGITESEGLVRSAMDRLSARVTPVAADLNAVGAVGPATAGGVNVTVNNPTPETASESTTRIMRRLALLGPA